MPTGNRTEIPASCGETEDAKLFIYEKGERKITQAMASGLHFDKCSSTSNKIPSLITEVRIGISAVASTSGPSAEFTIT